MPRRLGLSNSEKSRKKRAQALGAVGGPLELATGAAIYSFAGRQLHQSIANNAGTGDSSVHAHGVRIPTSAMGSGTMQHEAH